MHVQSLTVLCVAAFALVAAKPATAPAPPPMPSIVAPAEIENCLLQHEAVLECAVVGHEADGLVKPKAFVVLREGFDRGDALAEEIKQFVKTHIAIYKYPRWIEFVD